MTTSSRTTCLGRLRVGPAPWHVGAPPRIAGAQLAPCSSSESSPTLTATSIPGWRSSCKGVDHIIHAGDVGSTEVLTALRAIAPVTAVRGNCDLGGWADALPLRAEVELGGVRIVVGHMASRPAGRRRSRGQPMVVVSGHSHIASLERRDEVALSQSRFGRSPAFRTAANDRPPGDLAAGEGPVRRGRSMTGLAAEIVTVEAAPHHLSGADGTGSYRLLATWAVSSPSR